MDTISNKPRRATTQLRSLKDISQAISSRLAARRTISNEYVAPTSDVEIRLARIVTELLRLDQVGIHDNFFELGGHSLLATQVVSRVQKEFGIELGLSTFFDTPTVALLAHHMASSSVVVSSPIMHADRQKHLPLSFAQQRLWFLDQFQPGSAIYNVPTTVRLTGTLVLEALERALNEVVRRHDSLRTTFGSINGAPVQIIAPELSLTLHTTDFSHLAPPERLTHAMQAASVEATGSFNLQTGPLLRGRLFRLTEEDHIFVLCMHHIVSDGWSIGILVKEIVFLYNTFLQGAPSPLPPLPIQYVDFAAWQRDWLNGEALKKQLDYWKRQLEGAPAILEIPTDRPRPPVQSYRGATFHFSLQPGLTQQLNVLGHEHRATLFMVLSAAFNVLLHRYSGQEDICVGTSIAGRNRTEVEDLIGFFIKTLVLRTTVKADSSFPAVLASVRDRALEAYTHQDIPFEQLIGELTVERDLSHSPIFQTMFILQNAPHEKLESPGLTFNVLKNESKTAKYDLTCSMWEDNGQLFGSLEYSTDLFEETTIARLAGHYTVLLESICANPQERVGRLPMLTSQEHQQLIDWNATQATYPRDRLVHELFEDQVDRNPNAVAVLFENLSLTYDELNIKANRLAHHFRTLDVGPDVLVGICVDRSLDMVVAILAILKVGGAYLPLDPSYPQERLTYMLEDANPKLLVTQKNYKTMLAMHRGAIFCLDEDLEHIKQEPKTNPVTRSRLDNIAYVIYTSGSTGKPKGVQVPILQLINRFTWFWQKFPFAPGTVGCQKTSINFVDSLWEIFGYLLQGYPTVLISPSGLNDHTRLCETLADKKVTHFWLVPSLLRSILEGVPDFQKRVPSLKFWSPGGEPLTRDLVELFQATLPEAALVNLYGLSEAWDAVYSIYDAHSRTDEIGIGRPLSNVQTYILDSNLNPVPIGVPGELYIGGDGLARGYINRPGLTAEKFIANPFSTTAGARMYKTGDLARYRTNGDIEYLRRIDYQVKVRGFRIELGEIETVLSQYAAISDCVVAAREYGPGDIRLVAYVVPHNNEAFDVADIRRTLQKSLPDYMMPSHYMRLEKLPLTPNGKIDRRALPALEINRTEKDYEAPRTPTEHFLALVWADMLKLDRVDIRENFFDLGGHSLIATQLLSRIHQEYDVQVPLADLFADPTVAGLAALIEQSQAAPYAEIPLLPDAADYAVSHAQARLWMFQQLNPKSSAYHMPGRLELPAEITPAALKQALTVLVQRQSALRTIFSYQGNRLTQAVQAQMAVDLPEFHVESPEALAEVSYAHATAPFNLQEGPLFRAAIVFTWDGRKLLLWNIHHIISDATSMSIMQSEVFASIEAYREGKASPLPPLPIRYVDFAGWQNEFLNFPIAQTSRTFWHEQLAGELPILDLPYDYPVSSHMHAKGAAYRFSIPQSTLAGLARLAAQHNATPFMVLMSAFLVLLNRLTGQRDLIVGTPVNGREHPDVQQLIGFFINTVMLRNSVEPHDSFSDLLKRVRHNTLQAITHQSYPFEQLLDELKIARVLNRFPVSPIFFNFLNFMAPGVATGEQIDAHRLLHHEMKFDLDIYMQEASDGLRFDCHYRTALFKPATIEYLFRQYMRILEQVAAPGELAIKDFNVFPLEFGPVPRHPAMLKQAFTTFEAAEIEQSICDRFEKQVERHAGKLAIVGTHHVLTYQELNQAANGLAQTIINRSSTRNESIALLFEHDASAIIGMLGALKAGKAYVPLDPDYPDVRLRHILDNSKAKMLVTNQLNWALAQTLAGDALPIINIDEFASPSSMNSLDSVASPESNAYILYTSGSTGQPKGIAQKHRNVLHFIRRYTNHLHIGETDRIALFASYSSEAGVKGIFASLLNGATLFPLNLRNPTHWEKLPAWLANHGITLWHSIPAVYRNFLKRIMPHHLLAQLRLVVLGGDALLSSDIEVHQASPLANATLINLYGLTEASLNLMWEIDPNNAAPLRLGYPFQPGEIEIHNSDGQPAQCYEAGEIVIQSPFIALGYWQDPARSEQVFTQLSDGRHLYRTGDLGRFLPDGAIQYLGRKDFQVKIRGFRVELNEIEHLLNLHPVIAKAAVMYLGQPNSDKRLSAYIETNGPAPSPDDLRSYLAQHLPEYMVPADIICLPTMPLTPTGKIDRNALSKLAPAAPTNHPVAVQTPTEITLCAICAELLNLETVGIHDNFFDAGGHSLLAMSLISRVNQEFNVEIPIAELFQSPTLAQLASIVDTQVGLSKVFSQTNSSEQTETLEF